MQKGLGHCFDFGPRCSKTAALPRARNCNAPAGSWNEVHPFGGQRKPKEWLLVHFSTKARGDPAETIPKLHCHSEESSPVQHCCRPAGYVKQCPVHGSKTRTSENPASTPRTSARSMNAYHCPVSRVGRPTEFPKAMLMASPDKCNTAQHQSSYASKLCQLFRAHSLVTFALGALGIFGPSSTPGLFVSSNPRSKRSELGTLCCRRPPAAPGQVKQPWQESLQHPQVSTHAYIHTNIQMCIHVCVCMYNTIQYNTIQYNTTQHNTIQYNTIKYSIIQYNII